MISPLLRTALGALAPNRSERSWIAGSAVLVSLISRAPGDIDIHHLSETALEEAVERDSSSLSRLGFTPGPPRHVANECEIRFTRLDGAIFVNWVLEPGPPADALVVDPLLGVRASLREVLARKIAMYGESQDPKHAADLRDVLQHSPEIGSEVDLRWLEREVAALREAGPKSETGY